MSGASRRTLSADSSSGCSWDVALGCDPAEVDRDLALDRRLVPAEHVGAIRRRRGLGGADRRGPRPRSRSGSGGPARRRGGSAPSCEARVHDLGLRGSRRRRAAARRASGPPRSASSSSSIIAPYRFSRCSIRATCRPERCAIWRRWFHSGVVALGADQRDVLGDATPAPGRRGPPTAASIASLAITRYVVYLPPATTTRPGTGCADDVLAGQLRRLLRLAGEQRPQPGVHALDVLAGQRRGEHRVDVLEQVVDVRCWSRPGAPCPGASRCRWCRSASAGPTG